MRVSKEKAAENRQRILEAAAVLMREHGIAGVGVDALAEAAGVTHGGLYSQFGSKDKLAAEALRLALDKTAEMTEPAQDLASFVARYLSTQHRDTPGQGCAFAALGCEMPRASSAVRGAFTQGLRRMVDRVARLLAMGSRRKPTDNALAAVATMVGALVLARAVDDADFSQQILEAGRKSLTAPARTR